MDIRTAVLAFAGVFASAIHAQELHVTASGEACTPVGDACNAALFLGTTSPGVTVSPFTISYMLNTNAAQLSVAFEPSGGQNVLEDFVANFPVVNYRTTIGGQTTSASHGSGFFAFEQVFPGNNGYQLFGSANAGSEGYGFDTSATPLVTEAQYMGFKNPLADMLSLYTPSTLGAEATASGVWLLDGTITVKSVPVPTPEPMLLFASGLLLAGVASARSRFRSSREC